MTPICPRSAKCVTDERGARFAVAVSGHRGMGITRGRRTSMRARLDLWGSGARRGHEVRRIMGTEVEYGISVPGQPGANPMVTSSQVVNAYGARPELTRGGRARWDYEEESPLRDARGFTYSGAAYDPAEALADEDLGLANVILTNGARLYVDHAHPEYSHARGDQPARPGAVGQGRRAGDGRGGPAGRHHPGHPPDPPLQEQHRQQGRQLRRARELPDAPADPVRRHRHAT